MTKFNVGDILANYSGGLDKPAYQVVDNTNGVYRLRQIPSGNYFTWNYAIVERYNALYIAPTPPAKGKVYNLDYPANAKNGETITIKASVVNVGGTSGEFSLRLIAAPQMVLVTRHVGIVSAYKFTAPVNLQVTMPSSGASANLGVQCISMDEVIDDTKTFTIALTPPPVTCTGGSPHYGTGCALLKHFDEDNDGKVTLANAITALKSGASEEEARFISDAVHAGSINAKCPGCYTPARVCTEGAVRSPETCRDGSVIHKEVCRGNAWVSTGATCPTPPPVTCTGGSPHYGTGCALLKHYDTDNDGRVTARDARMARESGESIAEVQFILDASAAGSINAKCPGCYTPARVCTEGAVRSPETCRDGSVIHKEVCRGNAWVSTGATCPTPPPVTCTGGSPHYGTGCALLKHYDTDNDGRVTARDARMARESGESIAEVQFILDASAAGSINAKCPGCYTPARVCTEGAVRSPETCRDGSVIHKEVCRGNAWVSTGATCPTPPPVTCTGGSPHYGTGCALLKHYDTDNDGRVTARDARMARESGESIAEVQFILDASAAGSINAKCPGCYTPARVCTEGAVRSPETCRDGSVIHKEVCRGNAWVSTGATCPTPPPVTCTGGSPHYGTGCALLKHYDTDNDGRVTARDARMARESGESIAEVQFILDASAAGSINAKCPGCYTPARLCTEGAVRSPETCWDGSVIHKEVCRGNAWVSTGATCLTKPEPKPPEPECTEGDKKPGHVCIGGKWVPVGTPPPAPECTEGDKKPGYVCSGGKWISTGEPSTIEAPEIIPGIKPPRIPLLTTELAKIPLLPGWVIRDADGRIVAGSAPDTIEFQEIIPGIKPPRVPQLIPSLEKFPLLPGWTIRNSEGTVVASGAPLPTILEEK